MIERRPSGSRPAGLETGWKVECDVRGTTPRQRPAGSGTWACFLLVISAMSRTAATLGLAALAAAVTSGGCSNIDRLELCRGRPGTICTVVGTGTSGVGAEEALALESALYLPMDATVGPDGGLYVVDWNNHRIRRRTPGGRMVTVAGSGVETWAQTTIPPEPTEPIPALETPLRHPTQVVFDPLGRMWIAGWQSGRVQRVDPATGLLELVCGNGRRSYTGDGGPATDAALDLPVSIAPGAAGDLYILAQGSQVIRHVDGAGIIRRFAGQCVSGDCAGGQTPRACPDATRFTCLPEGDTSSCLLCQQGFAGDGGPALEARLSQTNGAAAPPAGRMAWDRTGGLVFADPGNHRVRRIDPSGVIDTLAGTGAPGFAGDGGPAREAELNSPTDVEVGDDGTIFVADSLNSCVRALRPDGILATVAGVCGTRGYAGDGAPATEALLNRPYGIALDGTGALYVADTYNHRIRMVMLR